VVFFIYNRFSIVNKYHKIVNKIVNKY